MQAMKSCWQCVECCIPGWCWKSQSETGGLLPGNELGLKGQLYTVRRISSFGRTVSKEDELDDTFLDKSSEVGSKHHNVAGGVDTNLPVPWASTAIPIQPGVLGVAIDQLSVTNSSGSGKKSKKKKIVSPSTKQKQSWTKALGRVQKRESVSKIKNQEQPTIIQANGAKPIENEVKLVRNDEVSFGKTIAEDVWEETYSNERAAKTRQNTISLRPPPLTLSDPNLLNRTTPPYPSTGLAASSIELRSFGNTPTLSIGHLEPSTWLKSQSMQDMQSVTKVDISSDRDLEREAVLRACGINLSHYNSLPATKSSEALHRAWRSLDILGKDDILQELPTGTVYFDVSFIQHNKKTRVNVNIERLEKLSGKGRECEPYSAVVKLTILPGEKHQKVSRPLPLGSSPILEQQFIFTMSDTVGKVLRISVYDQQWQGPYDAIGHVLFYLEDVPSLMEKPHYMKLYKQSVPDVNPGNLQASLCFNAEKELLTVTARQAHNLSVKLHKAKGECKTYVKISYYSSGKMVKEKQSQIVSSGQDAFYNFSTDFKIDSSGLQNSFIIIKLKLHNNMLPDKTIGRLILGPFFYTEGNSKLTPWGRAILEKELVSHSFRLYL